MAVMPDQVATVPPGSFLGPYAAEATDTELI
jgi:hypothetical protein